MLTKARSLDELSQLLNVDPAQVAIAQEISLAEQKEAEYRKRLVPVCGADIENSEVGLSGLFAHIAALVPDESVRALKGFDVGAASIPRRINEKSQDGKRGAGGRTRVPRKTRKNLEELIGAAGEIHAYRWLQLKYGERVISPSNWISGYSAKAFPDNAMYVDEGRGCDICFTVKGCTFYIEVKSSEESETSFTLGTSEVRLAREVAHRRRRRPREEFVILKVDNALTSTPAFTLLPNPYDPKYQDRFAIIDEGARVNYRQ
jgi:hypothetical protein